MTDGNSASIKPFEPNAAPGVPLAMLLWQIAGVIERLTDRQYVTKPVGVVESSIGGHIRHCLDHVTALLNGIETGMIDYEHRERGTLVETDRSAALALIAEVEQRLTEISFDDVERSVVLEVMLSSAASPFKVTSSIGRELAFVISHTIHHNALIGAMVKLQGGWLPERFGYAPSTVAFFARQAACAR